MLTLGVNAFHADAAACILQDGRLIAAAEEERFTRIKHWAGFPEHAIAFCLDSVGAEVRDLDLVAQNSDPSARLMKRILYSMRGSVAAGYIASRLRHRRTRSRIDGYFERTIGPLHPRTRVRPIEHHRAHLASSYYFSPFEHSAVLSVDGFGDFCSAAWGVTDSRGMDTRGEVLFPHSLGIFYQAMTQYLGFPSYGDEYKVMGLAAYGDPIYSNEMQRLITTRANGSFALNLRYFRHHRAVSSFSWESGVPEFEPLYSAELESLLGPARPAHAELTERHRNIAASVQARFEFVLFQLAERLRQSSGLKALCIAGGCAMNSVAMGKLQEQGLFEQVFVQPGAGDAGGALGAAVCAEMDLGKSVEKGPMQCTGWGPGYDDSHVARLLNERRSAFASEHVQFRRLENPDVLCERTAAAISEGQVVGWFQGRMEWGPRALGHRSILADPRRADMKSTLNAKIKRRESFRPFAPSILREAVGEWFETDDDVPFMTKVFRIRSERRSQIPAVTHVDGSGRLQTVTREQNARFYDLIHHFSVKTGVPMVLNTSFNENEPIVCRPEEAIDCFLRTRMDRLVLNDYEIVRHPSRP